MDLPENLAPLAPRASSYLPYLAWHGRKELSAEEFADYISVLGIGPADVSIVTGLDLPDPFPRRPPGAAEMARLIWDVRRLTSDQVKRVCDLAEERVGMANLSETP